MKRGDGDDAASPPESPQPLPPPTPSVHRADSSPAVREEFLTALRAPLRQAAA